MFIESERKGLILIVLVLFTLQSSFQLHGQNVLSIKANLIGNSDKVRYQFMESCDPGVSGEEVVWDFSNAYGKNEDYNLFYSCDSLLRYHILDGTDKNSYILTADTLKQYMQESRLTKIRYFQKKLSMKYPLQYGDSILSPFEGYGLYCGDHIVRVQGNVLLQGDGLGTLILSDKDTLDNVLRVYTLTTTSMAMGVDHAEIDSTKLQQEIEEKYEWYCRGFRYPVYAIVLRTSFTNLEPIGSTRLSYRILPESFSELADTVNDSIRNYDEALREREALEQADIFHYQITNEGSNVNIAYTTDTDANVIILISNPFGVLYKKQHFMVRSGESGIFQLDTTDLRKGQYILYINVKGKVYSKTINIR